MAKSIRTNTVILGEGATAVAITQGTVDPSAGAGVPAQLGSFYYQLTTSLLWQKVGSPDTAWVPLLAQNRFGDGSDGDVVAVSGTLTRDMFYRNLTVPAGQTLVTGGFRIYVQGRLTVEVGGQVSHDGQSATSNAGASNTPGNSVGVGGSGGGSSSTTNGGNGSNTTSTLVNCAGGAGGTGAGGSPGAGGTATVTVANRGGVRMPVQSMVGATIGITYNLFSQGAGGGAGAGSGSSSGGGGGAGGGVVVIWSREIFNDGIISANGGNGHTTPTANAGGGGGGGGGVVVLGFHYVTGSTPLVAGGNGGGGGAGGGAGVAGNPGIFIPMQM